MDGMMGGFLVFCRSDCILGGRNFGWIDKWMNTWFVEWMDLLSSLCLDRWMDCLTIG